MNLLLRVTLILVVVLLLVVVLFATACAPPIWIPS
jgi:hypothetical protein